MRGCRSLLFALLLCSLGAGLLGEPVLVEEIELDRTWAGHPVGYSLLCHGGKLYAAYYNAERELVVAERDLKKPGSDWVKKVLPTKVVWDSHNYVTMAMDDDNFLHVSGNMHAVSLIYFKMSRPLDVTSLERIPSMIGTEENRMTYPGFFRGPKGEFIYTYRHGSSGNGIQIYNVYDCKTKRWTRLIDKPLTSGKGGADGNMNAYLVGPIPGPDGWNHLCWVWRDNPSCDSNHDLSYARSRDLVHWETIDGKPVSLPMSIKTPGLIVDPSPVKGGMINMGIVMSFDKENRVVITYHKYDEKGKSQVYNARWENGAWALHQATDWDWRWEFTGGGSVPCLVSGSKIVIEEDGTLTQTYSHPKGGGGKWQLDPVSLKRVKRLPNPPSRMPKGTYRVKGTFPGLRVRMAGCRGTVDEPNVSYYLRWETLGPNRDRPRAKPWPEASKLVLMKVRND